MKTMDKITQAIERGEVFIAHRAYGKRFFFSTEDMEFGFKFFLGMVTHGGVTLGEMLHVASMVDEKKPDTFVDEMTAIAARVEARARVSLEGRHVVSAREGLLRASHYYRLAIAMVDPRKDSERWRTLHLKARGLFREAALLFDPPIEIVDIPFEDTLLPGYFIKAEPSDRPAKTLVMIGGGETFTEDLYFFTGPAALNAVITLSPSICPGRVACRWRGNTSVRIPKFLSQLSWTMC